MKNYKVAVEPILAAAGFDITAQETQRAGHSTQIVAGLAPQDFEAVVAVGGDGTVFEILQAGHPPCLFGCLFKHMQHVLRGSLSLVRMMPQC